MNRIFKVIYSRTKHMYVVASELAKSHSKSKNEGAPSGKALAALVMAALASVSFMAAPMTAEASTETEGWSFIGIKHDSSEESTASDNYKGAGSIGDNSITIGKHAKAGDGTIAIGDRRADVSKASVYVGQGDIAKPKTDKGAWVTSVGYNSDATGYGSIAIGSNAVAKNFYDKDALGNNIQYSQTYKDTSGKTHIALNADPGIQRASVALGYGASADNGNIAIGSYSDASTDLRTNSTKAYETETTADSYVSVGTSSALRRVSNVADGAADTDVATIAQLKKAVEDTNASNKANIGADNIGTNLKKADGTAAAEADITANKKAWAAAIGTGTVTKNGDGSEQLVTGGTVYNAIQSAKTKYYSVKDGIHLGSFKTNEDNDGASAIAGLAAGYETGTTGIASTVAGSYSGVIGSGLQGAAAVSLGTVNVNYNTDTSKTFSGVANSIVGQANVTENSNASLIYGAGNSVTDSYRELDTDALSNIKTAVGTKDATDLKDAVQSAVPKSGAQVMVMGGGNKITSAYMTQVIGVGNTITGKDATYAADTSTQYNYVDGSNNTLENGKGDYIIGANNSVTGDSIDKNQSNIVVGDNHTLTNKSNNVVIGSADKKDNKNKELTASDAVVIGHNADVTVDGGVAIGSGSVSAATATADAEGYDPTSTATNKASTDSSTTWKATTGAVSIGTNGTTTRRITNLAAGFNDTDAVNVAQIKKLANIDASNIGLNISDNDDDVQANASAWGKALGIGKIASPLSKKPGSDQLVTGGTMWRELREDLPTTNSIINQDFTTAVNLRNLDKLTVQYLVDRNSSKETLIKWAFYKR